MTTPEEHLARLEEQERTLLFDAFDQLDAWTLGRTITDTAIAAGHGVVIDIRRPGMVLFRAALPGSTADQESWAERKAALALRMESSSAAVSLRLRLGGIDPIAMGWLDAGYALAGGSFPVRVRGVGVVAAVTASGLSSDDDHALVVSAIDSFLKGRGSNAPQRDDQHR